MKKFKIKFEFFGKKLQTEIEAVNDIQAKEKIKNRVNFLECDEVVEPWTDNTIIDFMKGFMK